MSVANTPTEIKTVLCGLVGRTIDDMTRFSQMEPQDFCSDYGIDRHDVFALASGPLVVRFSPKLTLGFAGDDGFASVIVWDTSGDPEPMPSDLYSIEVRNTTFAPPEFREVLGRRINEVRLWKMDPPTVRYEALRRESVLAICGDGGHNLYLVYGFDRGPDNFTLFVANELPAALAVHCNEVSLCS